MSTPENDPEKTEVHQAVDPFAPPTVEPTPVVAPADATPDVPAGTAQPASDWLKEPAASEPDPFVKTPDAFTPLGTPKDEPTAKVEEAKEKAAEVTGQASEKVAEVKEQATEKVEAVKEQAAETVEAAKAKADEVKGQAQEAQAKAAAGAQDVQAKAVAFTEKPEGKVALAFVGGVVASLVLKRLSR